MKTFIQMTKLVELEDFGGHTDMEYAVEMALDCTSGAFWNIYLLSNQCGLDGDTKEKVMKIIDKLTALDGEIRKLQRTISEPIH